MTDPLSISFEKNILFGSDYISNLGADKKESAIVNFDQVTVNLENLY
jgi:hypothetical protein